MSKENINLDLSLAPPHSSHPQSREDTNLDSLHGRRLQLPSPAAQDSLHDHTNLDLSLPQSLQESLQDSGDEGRQLQLPSPTAQESLDGGQLQLLSPAVPESDYGRHLQHLSEVQESFYGRGIQLISPAVLESEYGRQSKLLSPAVLESVNLCKIQLPPLAIQESLLELLSPDAQESVLKIFSPPVQESVHGRQSQLSSPPAQESLHGSQLQLPSPAVQESVYGRQFQFPLPAAQESFHGRQLELPPPGAQESLHGRQLHLPSPAVQESFHDGQIQFPLPAAQESFHGGQIQLPSPAVQESFHGGQIQLPSPAVQESFHGGQLLFPLRAAQESFHGVQFQFPSQAVQESFHGVQFQLPPPAVQEPRSLLTPDPPLSQQLIRQETQPEEEIIPLYPWAKSTTAKVHTLDYLLSKNINMISGEIICTNCINRNRLEYNLREKFEEVCECIKETINQSRNIASKEWMKPEIGNCGKCIAGTLKPVISEKEEEINWLFLMLGQMLGCCKRDQLMYLRGKNSQHKLAVKDSAKNRLVYLAYLVICNQLDPTLASKLGFRV